MHANDPEPHVEVEDPDPDRSSSEELTELLYGADHAPMEPLPDPVADHQAIQVGPGSSWNPDGKLFDL